MKNKWKRFFISSICIFQSLTLAVPVGLISNWAYADDLGIMPHNVNTCDAFKDGANATFSPRPGNNNLGSCDDACGAYDSAQQDAEAKATATCGNPKNTGTVTVTDGSSTTTYDSYDQCFQRIRGEWGLLGQYCPSYKLYSIAWKYNVAAASAYTVAGVACMIAAAYATACNAGGAPACAAMATAEVACTVLGGAATATDIAGMIHLGVEGNKDIKYWSDGWTDELGMGITAAALGVGGTAAAYQQAKKGKVQKQTTQASADAAKKAGKKAAEEVGEEVAEKVAKKEAQQVANKAETASSNWVTLALIGGVFLATAGVEWGNFVTSKAGAECGCDTIKSMESMSGAAVSADAPKYSGAKPLGVGSGGSGATTSGGTSTSAINQDANNFIPSDQSSFPSGNLSAAMSGPLGPLLEQMPNHDKLADALAELGTNVGDIAKKLQSGQSPAQIASAAMPEGTPDSFTEGLDKLDHDIRAGKFTLPNSSTYSSGGGSRGPSSSKNGHSMLTFGSHFGAGASSGGAKALDFKKPGPVFDPNDKDIYHADYKGSIFQIVSYKLNKTRDRVEELEWASPLNRALMGLSNQPSALSNPPAGLLKHPTRLPSDLEPSKGGVK